MPHKKYNADDLYEINDMIERLAEIGRGNMTPEEKKLLSSLLEKRAKAMSDVLGVKINSVVGGLD